VRPDQKQVGEAEAVLVNPFFVESAGGQVEAGSGRGGEPWRKARRRGKKMGLHSTKRET